MPNNKKTRLIRIRVNQQQYERIENKAEAKGFESIAQYIRSIALEKDIITERKIDDIHRILINGKQSKQIIRTRYKKEDFLI